MQKTCCLYLRVSSEEQVTNFSLENQEKLCAEKAERLSYKIVKRYRDEGESAKTTDRPQFLEMLSYIKNNKKKESNQKVTHNYRYILFDMFDLIEAI